MLRVLRQSGLTLLAAIVVVLLAGCASGRVSPGGVPASGEIAGRSFSAPVDAEIARYFLEDYPAPHPEGWHAELAAVEVLDPGGAVADGALAEVARRFGSTDLAALLFIDRVHARERNRAFAACVAALTAAMQRARPHPRALLGERAAAFTVLLAPGWLYRSNPQTEADFARTRRALERIGLPYRFVPLREDGTVAANASRLAEAVRALRGPGRPVIVVSASKSAAEVALALGRLLQPGETRHVAAWINAGGVIHGTPLADLWTRFPRNLLARLAFLRFGWQYASLLDLRTDRSAARMQRVELPGHLLVVNYVAVPMAAQVSPGARDRYRLLSRFGPNDGLAPLANTLVAGGITLIEPGADHYFLGVDVEQRTLAMALAVQRHLRGQRCP